MDISHAPTAPKADPVTKILIWIAAVVEETLRRCPPADWSSVRAVALIMICTWLYQTALFCLISHLLFELPGQIRPELVLASMFIATFILLIDRYMIILSGWHLSGIEELKRGGLDISGGAAARIKAGFFLAIRIFLSIGIAQLTAIFMSILVFSADIAAEIRGDNLRANARPLAAITTLVDAAIQRATEAVTAETARDAALSAQVTALRQNQIDPSGNDPQLQQAQAELTQLIAAKAKADEEVQAAETFATNELGGIKGAEGNSGHPGDGLRHKAAMERVKNARDHAQTAASALEAARARLDALRKQLASASEAVKQNAHEQLPTYEDAHAAENAKLTSLKDELARLTKGRNEAIRDALENAPDHVPLDNGFLAQITALEHIAQRDGKIAAVILLIDLTSFGFELASVLAKVLTYVPTTYAALLARDVYMGVARIVDEMAGELERQSGQAKASGILFGNKPDHPEPANDNAVNGATVRSPAFGGPTSGGPDELPPQPPKRPRGRPRKNSIH